MIRLFNERGLITSDVDREELATSLLVLMAVETREILVSQIGWDPAYYQRWLDASVRALLAA